MLALFPLFWLLASATSYFVAVTKCSADGSSADSYIAYCLDRDYGDYEHEAFYFGLNDTERALIGAHVLFLGNSKMQYAFSRDNVAPFFEERNARFFLMGFGHGEQSRFPEIVLKRHPVRPTLAIINVDPFFTDGITEPASFPLQHPVAAAFDAGFKSALQIPRAWICRRWSAPALCRGEPAMMRSEATGQWDVAAFRPDPEPPLPMQAVAPPSDEALRQWLARAGIIAPEFLKTLSARCVVFTAVPSDAGSLYAQRLALQLGVPFIGPEISGLSLTTIDRIHLDGRSAQAWSDAFLRALDPVGRACGAW
ncbi:hypothetical protein BH11PSE3_BH11PSE3_24400 [soil metagenome]